LKCFIQRVRGNKGEGAGGGLRGLGRCVHGKKGLNGIGSGNER